VPLWAFLIIIKMAKEIQLTQGQVAIVDDEMYDYLNQWKWYASKQKNGKFYAERKITVNSLRKSIIMHRLIINNTDIKLHTDHINGITLDNRKINLRICTNSQNQMNKKTQINNKNGFKGVSYNKEKKKYEVNITLNGNKIFLGRHLNIIEAAKSYNEAAIKYFGEFANLNKID
jgi:hypothetical protein